MIVRNGIGHVDSRILDAEQTRGVNLPGSIYVEVILPNIQTISGNHDLMLETQVGEQENTRNADKSHSPNDIDRVVAQVKVVFFSHRFILGDVLRGNLVSLFQRMLYRMLCLHIFARFC